MRNTGVKVSDRRAVKVQNLIAASALLCGRQEAQLSDLWVLKYIWDTEEQIEVLVGIVDKVVEEDELEKQHPQALANKLPNPEELLDEVRSLKSRLESAETAEELNVIKDKLRFVQNRAEWIQKSEHKTFIDKEIEELWKQLLSTT